MLWLIHEDVEFLDLDTFSAKIPSYAVGFEQATETFIKLAAHR